MPGEGSTEGSTLTTVGPDGPGVAGRSGDYSLARRARLLRRVGLAVLFGFVGLGGVTVLGVRSTDSTARGGGLELTVHHAAVSRGGLATPWSVRVHRPGGFDEPVRLMVSGSFLDSFDENGLDPDPAASTASGVDVIWEFDPPPGDVFTLTLDARVEPAVMGRREGHVAVVDDDDNPIVEASFTMWVLP